MIEKIKEVENKLPEEVAAVKDVEKPLAEVPVAEEVPEVKLEPALAGWKPRTSLGQEVLNGTIASIDEILASGRRILEPEIVDKLVPNLKNELILIGGRTGKGGGIQRIPVKITAAMHKSGRRFTTSAFVVVGNEDGLVGIGLGRAPETRNAIAKAIQRAKMNIIRIKIGCGSWECDCGTRHSVPFKTTGKCGSVRAVLQPAPKGVGLVSNDESKKLFKLAGIKDVWIKTFGNTSARINLISAIYDALKKLYVFERAE